MDFDGPNVEDADLRMSCVKKTQESTARLAAFVRRRGTGSKPSKTDVEKNESQSESEKPGQSRLSYGDSHQMVESKERPHLAEENSNSAPPYLPDASTAAPSLIPSRVPSPQPFSASASTAAEASPFSTSAQITPAISNQKSNQLERNPTQASEAAVALAAAVQSHPSFRVRALAVARSAARSLLMPCSVTIVFSIVIAVVTPLKALFTPVANSPIPNAPDGQPPLAFILDW